MSQPTVRELHNQAMAITTPTLFTDMPDDEKRSLFRQGLELERQAADRIPNARESEPTRSILYRSASWMAVHAGEPDEALRLAREGLAGFPPPSVAAELHEVIAFVEHGTMPDE